ncbi:presequence translocated-associated motor subunit [Cavenderia fasciculata]|uniref:Presequence translocated-associated motor subunit n=1 Tax=Cavenderia fasciculata TaxID=261658 RepID=F4Q4R6_CACFS|nr:presequence translocated-associated motor subunit [Cavenderia fasciculata]EGG17862.1 presequence translocated-associated motor subunit [Cavenderia fasciculata]|eukprot:XP_004356346.1 presequence translocated-associated motor subunit [Cavenderia fasciculata]
MVVKIFANLLITTGTVFARSLAMAYKQAIARAESGGAQTASDLLKGGKVNAVMSTMEAKKILGLESKTGITIEDVTEKYDDLLETNKPEDGGSLYVQKKIMGAKICLENELNNGKEI